MGNSSRLRIQLHNELELCSRTPQNSTRSHSQQTRLYQQIEGLLLPCGTRFCYTQHGDPDNRTSNVCIYRRLLPTFFRNFSTVPHLQQKVYQQQLRSSINKVVIFWNANEPTVSTPASDSDSFPAYYVHAAMFGLAIVLQFVRPPLYFGNLVCCHWEEDR